MRETRRVLRLGFTGSREGPTEAQKARFILILEPLVTINTEFHHGDCVGADAWAAAWMVRHGATVICHPPKSQLLRAHTSGNYLTMDPKDYLERNRNIVHAAGSLIAMPQVGSRGSLYTIGYAKKLGRDCLIIDAEGRTKGPLPSAPGPVALRKTQRSPTSR